MKYLVCLSWLACTQLSAAELDTVQMPTANIHMEVTDVKKVEAKAIAIVRNKDGLTLAEAQALFRVNGKTNVARCVEYIIRDAVFNASPYLGVDYVQVVLAH